MQSLLSSFHLDIRTFSELLQATSGIVAGSAPLAALVSETSRAFVPNDLDIWVHSDFFLSSDLSEPDHPAVAVRKGYQFLFAYFLGQHGYTEVFRPVQSDDEYTSNPIFAIIRNIQRFQHSSGKVIQVMHCKKPINDILETFDLSVAKTWWVPNMQHDGQIYSADIDAALAGSMYSLRQFMSDREKARIQKYEARGFKYVVKDA